MIEDAGVNSEDWRVTRKQACGIGTRILGQARELSFEPAQGVADGAAHSLIKRALVERAKRLRGEIRPIFHGSERAVHLRGALAELAGPLPINRANDVGGGIAVEIAARLE